MLIKAYSKANIKMHMKITKMPILKQNISFFTNNSVRNFIDK